MSNLLPNGYYANLLQDVYAGSNSESKMFLQFLYFAYTLCNFDNDFLDVFYKIAKDDIEHHSLLGEMIVRLGGDPVYKSSKNVYMSFDEIEDIKGLKQILNLAIELKEKIIISYKILLKKIVEKEIKNILEIIVCDEETHKELLENLLKKYQSGCWKYVKKLAYFFFLFIFNKYFLFLLLIYLIKSIKKC